MIEFIFNTLWGWWGVAGITVIACIIVGYFFPSLRLQALAVAGVVISAASLVAKGARMNAELEKKRREEAVRKARKEYEAIDNRHDTAGDAVKRLRDGSF